MEYKICNTCKRELPLTNQYFYRFVHAKDGYKSSCKECQGGNFKVKELIPDGMRKCSRCQNIYPATEEYFLKYFSKKDNRNYLKSHCLECGKKSCKQWREANREHYLEYAHNYQKSAKGKESDRRYKENHKEEIKEYKKLYRRTHKEQIKAYDKNRRFAGDTREKVLNFTRRWREANKEAVAEYNREYVQSHQDYFRQAAQKRTARKKQVENSFTLAEWENAKKYFNDSCAYCGKRLQRLTQDHFIPLSKGGAYRKDNIVPACKSCNSSKHTNDFKEWYKGYKFYDVSREQAILNYINNMAIPR